MKRVTDRDHSAAQRYFAVRLKQLRLARGLSQREAEDRSSATTLNLSRYERGIELPSVAMLPHLAAALGVRVCELVCVLDARWRTDAAWSLPEVEHANRQRQAIRMAPYAPARRLALLGLALPGG